MRYDDTIDDAKQYLRVALEWMGKYSLATNPVNDNVWYEYASGKNHELRMIASTIKSSIKGKDHAARIGGEAFAIILPPPPFDGAMKLADNMRLTFEHLDLKKKNTGESLGRITLSFGVAIYQPNQPTDDFVRRADEALYQSKKTGRNKVTGG